MITWIAIDWGTSNLRVWGMDSADNIVDSITSDKGMAGLTPDQFEPTLLGLIEAWLPDDSADDKAMPIVACGMVGARQGWVEAPYDNVPCLPAQKTIKAPCHDKRINMHIISGVCQNTPAPADVMRGEETQIAGFIAQQPDYNGIVCLPGTHSKWAMMENGNITWFKTSLTGELFALISGQSVLKHSLGDWDDTTFIDAVKHHIASPEQMLTNLFSIRANHLLHGANHGIAYLSGSLIGSELAGLQHIWQTAPAIILIGEGKLARLYQLALQANHKTANIINAEMLVLDGLKKIYHEKIIGV